MVVSGQTFVRRAGIGGKIYRKCAVNGIGQTDRESESTRRFIRRYVVNADFRKVIIRNIQARRVHCTGSNVRIVCTGKFNGYGFGGFDEVIVCGSNRDDRRSLSCRNNYRHGNRRVIIRCGCRTADSESHFRVRSRCHGKIDGKDTVRAAFRRVGRCRYGHFRRRVGQSSHVSCRTAVGIRDGDIVVTRRQAGQIFIA